MIDNLIGGENQLINILGGIGFFVLTAITIYTLYIVVKKIKNEKSEGQLAKEEWDGIGEYYNPLPVGWAVIQVIVIVFAAWYWLIGYPTQSFSQVGQWNQELTQYKAEFEKKWDNIDGETMVEMGKGVFLTNCAQCHGLTGDGLDGKAANLTKRIDEVAVRHIIANGSEGVSFDGFMPGREELYNDNTGEPITDAMIEKVAPYVANGFPESDVAGKEVFDTTCASCHDVGGIGMEYTAPNISKFTEETIMRVAKHGKKGAIGSMPAFEKAGILTDLQYKAVAHYIMSISN